MLAVLALNDKAKEGIVLYTAAYSLATIGLFAILIKMKDYTIDGFNGLYKNSPVLAIAATVFLLSLTGIPLTAGFQAKFYLLLAMVATGHNLWVVIVAVLFAAMSAFYYFRVIQAIYFKEPNKVEEGSTTGVTPAFKGLLVLTIILIIAIGVYPELVLGWLYF